jgi:hypothetical protein
MANGSMSKGVGCFVRYHRQRKCSQPQHIAVKDADSYVSGYKYLLRRRASVSALTSISVARSQNLLSGKTSELPLSNQTNPIRTTTVSAMFALVSYFKLTNAKQPATASGSSTCLRCQAASAPTSTSARNETPASPSSHSSPKTDSVTSAKEEAQASDFFYIGQ